MTKLPTSYTKKVSRIIGLGMQQNINGNQFPIFCVSLGFEALVHSFSGYQIKETKLSEEDHNERLSWVEENYQYSYFSKVLRPDIKTALSQKPLSYFSNHFGFTLEDFNSAENLTRNFRVLATSDFLGKKNLVVAV